MDDLLLSLPMMARVQPGPDADSTVQAVFIDGDNGVRVTLSLPFDAAVLLRRGVLLGEKADGVTAVVSVEGSGVGEGLAEGDAEGDTGVADGDGETEDEQ